MDSLFCVEGPCAKMRLMNYPQGFPKRGLLGTQNHQLTPHWLPTIETGQSQVREPSDFSAELEVK